MTLIHYHLRVEGVHDYTNSTIIKVTSTLVLSETRRTISHYSLTFSQQLVTAFPCPSALEDLSVLHQYKSIVRIQLHTKLCGLTTSSSRPGHPV